MHFELASTVLMSAVFRGAALIGGEALIRGRRFFQCGYPKVRCLFEAQCLLEEIRYATQGYAIVWWKKYETFHIKVGNFFFSKETFLVYPTQKNRKTYNARDLLALSRVSELIRALPFYPPIHTQSHPPIKML